MARPNSEELQKFVDRMEERLDENDDRDPTYEEVSLEDLREGIFHNVAGRFYDGDEAEKCIDIANYAFLLFTRFSQAGIV